MGIASTREDIPATAREPERWRRTRLGGVGLLLRHRGPVRGPSLVVAILVLAVSALVAATPSVFTSMTASELNQTVSQAPPTSRYLIARPAGRMLTAPSVDPGASGLSEQLDDQFGSWQDQLEVARRGLPAQLRAVVGPARWTQTMEPAGIGPTNGDPSSSATTLIGRIDVRAASVARIVAGDWPASSDDNAPVGIVLSEASARAVGVSVGSMLGAYRVSGIFRAIDPNADYWALNPGMVQPNIFNDGNVPIRITVTGFVDPERWIVNSFRDPTILVWYPLRLSGLSGDRAAQLLAELRNAVATPQPMPAPNPEIQQDIRALRIDSITLSAPVIGALQGAIGRMRAAQSVLTVAAVGPLAAAIAVLALAIRALDRRRRPLIGMAATRGAAPRRLRLLLAADGLLTGLPAAILAAAAIWWIFGVNTPTAGIVLALAVGLLPAAMLAAMPIAATMRRTRADTGIRSTSRLRWVAEAAIIALAAVSLYLLLTTGLGAGGDLLVAAAPLLLAAACCVIVLRLYPLPLHPLARVFRRRRTAVGYLGSLRALRDPVVGVAPVLAVLAGVSVAVFSATTLSTLTHGADQAALAELGAPIRATAGTVTDAQYRAIQAMPGVAAAARTTLVGTMSVQVGDRPTRPTLDVYLADTEALHRVQAAVPDAVPLPAGGLASTGAIVTTDLAADGTTLAMGQVHARITGHTDLLTGLGRSPDFVLLDSAVTGFGPFRPTSVLIAPTPSADTTALTTHLTTLLGPTSTVTLAADNAAALRTGAIATGMRTALIAALAAAAIAAIAALTLTMLLSTTARARLLAILRILGLSARQRRALVLWEQAPAATVALVVGAALGLGLAALVHTAVDLTPFTGGRTQPALHANAALLAALIGGFVLLVVAATWTALRTTHTITTTTAIKLDED